MLELQDLKENSKPPTTEKKKKKKKMEKKIWWQLINNFENGLPKFQYSFRKRFRTQHRLLFMLEK